MTKYLFILLLFFTSVLRGQPVQAVGKKEVKTAWKNAYAGLQAILFNPYEANAKARSQLVSAAHVFDRLYATDSITYQWAGGNAQYMRMAENYLNFLQSSHLAEQRQFLESASKFYQSCYYNNSFDPDWFYADLLIEGMETFYQDNLYEILRLRNERLEAALTGMQYERVINALVDLASVELDMGYFDLSQKHIHQAISEIDHPELSDKQKWQHQYDKGLISSAYAVGIGNYLLLDSIEQANQLFLKASARLKNKIDFFTTPELYVAQAHLLLKQGKYVKALQLLDFYIQTPAETDGNILALIALCYQKNGTYELADTFFRKSLAYFQNNDNTGMQVAQAQLNLANFYSVTDNTDTALTFARRARQTLSGFIKKSFPTMTTGEKQTALKRQEIFLSQLGKLVDNEALRESAVFANILLEFSSMYKGLTVAFSQSIYDMAMKDTSVGACLSKSNDYQKQLAYNYSHTRNSIAYDAEAAEHKLLSLCIDKGLEIQDLKTENIQTGLSTEAVLIDYIDLGPEKNGRKYAAVLLKSQGDARIFSVFSDSSIYSSSQKQLLASRGMNISIHERKSTSRKLAELMFPEKKDLNGIEKVYISPSGSLYELSFYPIINKLDSNLSLVYLLSPWSLSRKVGATIAADSIYFRGFGNARFNEMPASLANKTFKLDTCHGPWISLPGTGVELGAIQKKFRKMTIVTDSEFSEMNFRAYHYLDFKHMYEKYPAHIIHIATHGFFVQNATGNFFESNANPLVRCGILASGANCVWQADSSNLADIYEYYYGFDGVITGLEISTLDMHGTRLLVLSACETARGDGNGMDGPMGLPRAFKMAGVDYILVALWPVPDEETAAFMEIFYENLRQLKNIEQALQVSQRESALMGLSADAWGAFILYH